MNHPIMRKHIQRGVEWLDKVQPGWEYNVDLATLRLSDPDHCVCGG